MDAHSTVTAVDGDRYPIRPPNIGGISSAGRAAALQAVGQRFDPVILLQFRNTGRPVKATDC